MPLSAPAGDYQLEKGCQRNGGAECVCTDRRAGAEGAHPRTALRQIRGGELVKSAPPCCGLASPFPSLLSSSSLQVIRRQPASAHNHLRLEKCSRTARHWFSSSLRCSAHLQTLSLFPPRFACSTPRRRVQAHLPRQSDSFPVASTSGRNSSRRTFQSRSSASAGPVPL